MKKFIYLFMVLGLVITTACNPLEDIYTALDAQEEIITGEVSFELTDDDYSALNLGFGNFSSTDDAKAMIPGLLIDKYPVWGEGSLATVTFKKYFPKKTEKSLTVYTVTTADYDAQGGSVAQYNNFSSSTNVTDFLNWKYPNPADRLLVSLTYKYYSGGVKTLKNGFLYINGGWEFLQGFTQDDYNAMGENYANFTSKTVAQNRIPIYLKDYFKYETKEAGDIQGIMYNIYQKDYDDIDGDGSTTDKTTYSYAIYFIYDGVNWAKYNNVINETIKFGHDGITWVPDNTIKYTLTSADYALVGNDRYGNFDVRAGKAEESVEARLAKINTILLNNFPGMAEGQKFAVSYNVYSGANEVWEMKVILSGGVYVLQ